MLNKSCNPEDYLLVTNPIYLVIIITIVLYSFSMRTVFIIFEVEHVLKTFTVRSACDIYHTGVLCACVRMTIHFFSVSLVILQVGLCIERTIATVCSGRYEKTGPIFGVAYCLLTVIVALTAAILINYQSVSETYISCLNNSHVNRERVDVTNYILTGGNCVALVWVTIIYGKNKLYLKKIDLGLSNRYQIRENVSSSRMTIVVGFTQLLFFTTHLAINMSRRTQFTTMDTVLYRTLESIGYLLTYYSLILPIVMYVYIKRDLHNKIASFQNNINQSSSKGVEGSNLYFGMYEKHW
ncbi:integral membrane protein Srb [Ostertagia ostertagi]